MARPRKHPLPAAPPIGDPPTEDAVDTVAMPADVIEAKKLPSRRELDRQLNTLTEEYRWLGPEASAGHGPAIAKRHELARDMKRISELLFLREPDVEVTVTRSATGHPFSIGERKFVAGRTYTVKASVAQTLLHMMDANRRQELARLQQNGYDVDLTAVADKARYAEISREP